MENSARTRERVLFDELPGFDAGEFAGKWRSARISSLRSTLGAEIPQPSPSEAELLDHVVRTCDERERESVLRLVFENSRKLAISAMRHFGASAEIGDFERILSLSGVSCYTGKWTGGENARILSRAGCAAVPASFVCDYWREALDGFVTGLGEDERLARHRSRGHGDDCCVDVLFMESTSRSSPAGDALPRLGKVPVAMALALDPVKTSLAASGVELRLDGFSEGILYYRLHSEKAPMCGPGGRLLHDSFLRQAGQRLPGVAFQNATPLGVQDREPTT